MDKECFMALAKVRIERAQELLQDAKHLEEFDNGGIGDYTKEKYEQPDYSLEDILKMK